MPELPEVECLTKAVRSVALGARLEKMAFFRKDLRDPIPIKSFEKAMAGRMNNINAISRRSKYMLWEVDEQWLGIFHLGMSGNMLLNDSEKPSQKHTHAVFSIRQRNRSKLVHLHFVD